MLQLLLEKYFRRKYVIVSVSVSRDKARYKYQVLKATRSNVFSHFLPKQLITITHHLGIRNLDER